MIYRCIKYASALTLPLIPAFVFGMHNVPEATGSDIALTIRTDRACKLPEGCRFRASIMLERASDIRRKGFCHSFHHHGYLAFSQHETSAGLNVSVDINQRWHEIAGDKPGEFKMSIALVAHDDTYEFFNTSVKLPLRQQMDVVVYQIAPFNLNGTLAELAGSLKVMVVVPQVPVS